MFCRAQPDCIYVGKVAVAPELQGQGVGRKLFAKAFQLANEAGLSELELETRVELKENYIAFSKLGFKQIGTTSHLGYDRPTSIVMRAKV